jgi:hypothetical protein
MKKNKDTEQYRDFSVVFKCLDEAKQSINFQCVSETIQHTNYRVANHFFKLGLSIDAVRAGFR